MQGSSLNCSITGGRVGEVLSYKGLITLAQGEANAEEMFPRNLSTVLKKTPSAFPQSKGEKETEIKQKKSQLLKGGALTN